MSGLAKVARILGAEVTGSDRALGGHDAANVPPGAEVVYSSAIPPDNPERTTGAPELHRADLLAELTRAQADDRRLRHPRQDQHHVDARPRAARRELPGRRRGALDGHQRRLDGRRVADRRGRRVRPEPAQAAPHDRGRDQRRARPPHRVRLIPRRGRDLRHVPRARERRRRRARPPQASPGRPRLRGVRRRAQRPRRPQPAQRRRGAEGDRAGRGRRRKPPPRGSRPSRARAGASRTSATPPAAPASSTTTPTTRPRSARRSRPPARRTPSA